MSEWYLPVKKDFSITPSFSCVTCADEAVGYRICRVNSDQLTAWVQGPDQLFEIDVSLIEPVGLGDIVLVHGGAALSIVQRNADGVGQVPTP